MKYRLFLSVYKNVDDMLSTHYRDQILDIHNNSPLFTVEAATIKEAICIYENSKEFDEFVAINANVRIYCLDNEGNPREIEDKDHFEA